MVPGNKIYASATKYGKKIVVISDSHLKRIKRNLFKNLKTLLIMSFIKPFDGAKIEHIKHCVMPFHKEQKPDIIVIHEGGNDINCKIKGNVNVNELADNIINLAVICRDFGVPDIAISEVLPKKSITVTAIIRKINDRVKELFKNQKFHFYFSSAYYQGFLIS